MHRLRLIVRLTGQTSQAGAPAWRAHPYGEFTHRPRSRTISGCPVETAEPIPGIIRDSKTNSDTILLMESDEVNDRISSFTDTYVNEGASIVQPILRKVRQYKRLPQMSLSRTSATLSGSKSAMDAPFTDSDRPEK